MSNAKNIQKMIADNDVKFVNFQFTDMRGAKQNTEYAVSFITEDFLNEGVPFDGSSIAGWQGIEESDMLMVPDFDTAVMDPFAASPTLILTCNIHDPISKKRYSRCPRSIAHSAESYMNSLGIASTAYFGPEAEFFMFDDVRFQVAQNNTFFEVDSEEGPYNNGRKYEHGNVGHRPQTKGGYFPVGPVDHHRDIRAEMLSTMEAMGVVVEKHHHEVAPAQSELGFKYQTLVKCADHMQLYKYVIKNVAHNYGKTVTFMPKPIKGDNGSGMHVHQSLWKDGKPLFAGDKYAGLSEMALYYIGGIIKHARHINAFCNPTTNSYKRLIPGYEAPVLLAYSSRNRSASVRIPIAESPKAKRIEVRFPDPSANPYLAYAALLMAGLDGIKNKITPGEAIDKNLYELPAAELAKIPNVCTSLQESLASLDNNRAFLKHGDVFTDDFIDSYIKLKLEELRFVEQTPHPAEYQLYYSV